MDDKYGALKVVDLICSLKKFTLNKYTGKKKQIPFRNFPEKIRTGNLL